MIKNQEGLTFITFLIGLVMIIYFTTIGIHIIPAYIENYFIKQELNSIATEYIDSVETAPTLISKKIQNYIEINSIQRFSTKNLSFTQEQGKLQLHLRYDVQEHLFANIDVVLHFDDSVAIPIQ